MKNERNCSLISDFKNAALVGKIRRSCFSVTSTEAAQILNILWNVWDSSSFLEQFHCWNFTLSNPEHVSVPLSQCVSVHGVVLFISLSFTFDHIYVHFPELFFSLIIFLLLLLVCLCFHFSRSFFLLFSMYLCVYLCGCLCVWMWL